MADLREQIELAILGRTASRATEAVMALVEPALTQAFDEGRRCGLRQADWEYGATPTMPDLANPYYRRARAAQIEATGAQPT